LRKVVAILGWLAAATMLPAQTPEVPAVPVPTLRATTTLVLAPAVVKTHAGEPVFTLQAADFELTDNGQPQTVALDEDTGGQPLALAVVIQTGGLGGRQFAKYRHLDRYLDELAGTVPHRVAVIGFDSAPHLAAPFTRDLDQVNAALDNLEPGDRGAATLDALDFAVRQLATQPVAYRRAILLLSETADHASQISLDDALRELSRTNTAIYAVAFASGRSAARDEASRILSDPTPGPAHGCMARDPVANQGKGRAEQTFDCLGLLAPPLRLAKAAALAAKNGFVQNIPETAAHLSGGEYFSFGNAAAVDRALMAINHHLPNRYLLSFTPRSPEPGFHSIAVRLRDRPNLVVEARTGYWAEPLPAAAPSAPLIK
jgi:VWFA-related protein